MANSNGGPFIALGAAFAALPGWLQIFTVVGTIAVGGATFWGATGDYRELPERVLSLEEAAIERTRVMGHEMSGLNMRVEVLSDSIMSISRRINRLICLQEAAAGQHGYQQCAR